MHLHENQTKSLVPAANVRLPSRIVPAWDQLTDFSFEHAGDPDFEKKIALLKQSPGNLMSRLSQAVLNFIPEDQGYTRLLRSSWDEMVDIIGAQIAENTWISRHLDPASRDLKPLHHRSRGPRKFSFGTPPATQWSVKRRAEVALSLCDSRDPILILGDDDLLSLELAQSGFRHVTVVDRNCEVLGFISQKTTRKRLPVTLVHQDLTSRFEPKYLRDYKLVFMDPYDNISSFRQFAKAAMDLTSPNPGCRFFVSLHLMSLFKRGLNDFSNVIGKLGLEVAHVQPAFNNYRIPSGTRHLISIMNHTITRAQILNEDTATHSFFTSDAILLKKRVSNTAQKPKAIKKKGA